MGTNDEPLPLDVPKAVDTSKGFSFSRAAMTPPRGFAFPHPDGADFDQVRGDHGDLIVIQTSSGIGSDQSRQSALRTLRLTGPHSASLHMSGDPTVWGNVQKVRDLVAVMALPDIRFKSKNIDGKVYGLVGLERFSYGTGNKPAEMWRDDNGQYFAYEIGKRAACTAFWSTGLDLDRFLAVLEDTGLPAEGSQRGYIAREGGSRGEVNGIHANVAPWAELARDLDGVVKASIPLKVGHTALWQSPFRRFHDQEFFMASVGVSTAPVDIAVTRAVITASGPTDLLLAGNCRIRAHGKGKMREYRVL